jgi:hypothetical protein
LADVSQVKIRASKADSSTRQPVVASAIASAMTPTAPLVAALDLHRGWLT